MNGVTIVHLLRHGKVHNPDHVLFGRLPDSGSAPWGSRPSSPALPGRAAIGRLACSPLERARQTAGPLAGLAGLTPVIDDA